MSSGSTSDGAISVSTTIRGFREESATFSAAIPIEHGSKQPSSPMIPLCSLIRCLIVLKLMYEYSWYFSVKWSLAVRFLTFCDRRRPRCFYPWGWQHVLLCCGNVSAYKGNTFLSNSSHKRWVFLQIFVFAALFDGLWLISRCALRQLFLPSTMQ